MLPEIKINLDVDSPHFSHYSLWAQTNGGRGCIGELDLPCKLPRAATLRQIARALMKTANELDREEARKLKEIERKTARKTGR